jgi:NDP-sugar pyrophosphorylase family protein
MTLPVAILAGGLATRLGAAALDVPKSLLDVGGRPFAEHQLELLRRNGVREVVFCCGHLGEMIREALGDGSSAGMTIRYSFDGPKLLGTGGALRKALPFLGPEFFVLYGDSYLDCDYIAVERAWRESHKPGLMTVFRNSDRWDRSNVLFRNGNIEIYDKVARASGMKHIDYGLGILRAEIVARYPEDAVLDLATIYQDLVAQRQLAGFETEQRFYEIGSPAGLEETRNYLAHKRASIPG